MLDLSFSDWIHHIETSFLEDKWITLYRRYKTENGFEKGSIYTGLVKRKYIKEILDTTNWERIPEYGLYGITIGWCNKRKTIFYNTYHDKEVEPIVYIRDFEGCHPDIISIIEEFILNFQLIVKEHQNNTSYYFIDDNRREEEAIRIEDNLVRIDRKFLLEYVYVKRMDLVLYFDLWRFSNESLEDLGFSQSQLNVKNKQSHYDVYIDELKEYVQNGRSQGWIMGKRIYRLPNGYKSWYFDKDETAKEYEKFIIGEGKSGEDICHTCDEKHLDDFYGKNPGSPNYLTPVFFDRGVMKKYYDNPEKYRVRDSCVELIGRWSLRIDNNRSDVVISYLGYIGRLPNIEQRYWRSFNIKPITHKTVSSPDAKLWRREGMPRLDLLSDVAYKRGVLAEFTQPEAIDLVFKDTIHKFYERFFERNGWHIIKPLSDKDSYRLPALHIPVDDSEIELKNQVESMCVILVESINASKLESILCGKNENEKSISLLKRFLEMKQIDDEGTIYFLLNLNTLRNLKLHRISTSKPKPEQKRAIEYFSLESSSFSDIMMSIFYHANRLLSVLIKVSQQAVPV